MSALVTAAAIFAAAREFNAVDADADWTQEDLDAAIEHAQPFVRVIATRGSRGGVKVLSYACIDDPAGDGAWACEEPTVTWLKDTDGRLSPARIAERASRYIGVAGAEVPVRFESGGRR